MQQSLPPVPLRASCRHDSCSRPRFHHLFFPPSRLTQPSPASRRGEGKGDRRPPGLEQRDRRKRRAGGAGLRRLLQDGAPRLGVPRVAVRRGPSKRGGPQPPHTTPLGGSRTARVGLWQAVACAGSHPQPSCDSRSSKSQTCRLLVAQTRQTCRVSPWSKRSQPSNYSRRQAGQHRLRKGVRGGSAREIETERCFVCYGTGHDAKKCPRAKDGKPLGNAGWAGKPDCLGWRRERRRGQTAGRVPMPKPEHAWTTTRR